MQLLVDGLICESSRAASVADAIAHGSQHANRDGRCVVEVYVDGRRLNEDDLSSSHALAANAAEVRLVTATPQSLARDAFAQAVDTLEEIDRLQQDAAEQIQADRIPAAMENLEVAIEAWLQIRDVITKGAAMAGLDLTTAAASSDVTLDRVVGQLNTQLSTMVEALQGRDPITLADTLLYEMPAVILDFKHLLNQLAEAVAEDA